MYLELYEKKYKPVCKNKFVNGKLRRKTNSKLTGNFDFWLLQKLVKKMV